MDFLISIKQRGSNHILKEGVTHYVQMQYIAQNLTLQAQTTYFYKHKQWNCKTNYTNGMHILKGTDGVV